MTDSMRAIRSLCQRCGQWREGVNQETEWTCRECHLEQQGQRLLALVETRGRELAEARGVAVTLWTALEVMRRRGLDPEVQGLFDRTESTRPSWLTLPPWPEKTP